MLSDEAVPARHAAGVPAPTWPQLLGTVPPLTWLAVTLTLTLTLTLALALALTLTLTPNP